MLDRAKVELKNTRLLAVTDAIYALLVQKKHISERAIARVMKVQHCTLNKYCQNDSRVRELIFRYKKMTLNKCLLQKTAPVQAPAP